VCGRFEKSQNQKVALEEAADTYASMLQGRARMKASAGHILYIEDDEDTRELVKYAMAMNNYKVIAAADWEGALQLARTNHFDLYLIDNWMSGGSGIEFCKRLREFDSSTPILFYSGAALESDKQQAFAAGAQGYLVKPAGPDELMMEVSRIISGAKRTRAVASF